MKTTLLRFTLIAAVATPAALIAELSGVPVPVALDWIHLLGGFVAALTVLTALGDYREAAGPARSPLLARISGGKATHPLAA